MLECISRRAAIEVFSLGKENWKDYEAAAAVANLPIVDVVARDCYDRLLAENDELRKVRPRATGFWIEHDDDILGLTYECSNCRKEGMENGRFCGNCGAKMEGEA